MFRSPTITPRKNARPISPSDARTGRNMDLRRPENSPALLFFYEDSGPQILPLPFCPKRNIHVTSERALAISFRIADLAHGAHNGGVVQILAGILSARHRGMQ